VEDPNLVKAFHSPMILEFPAPDLLRAIPAIGWLVQGVGRYSCEGVYFSLLRLKSTGKPKSGVTFRVEGALAVGPGFDREARVVVELLADGKVVGRGDKNEIDAEERKSKPFRFAFKLSPKEAALLETADRTTVRVTLFLWAS
jgi:hypothetical protein